VALAESGVLKKYNVRLLGANLQSIKKAEERDRFKKIITDIGLEVPKSGYATYRWEEARKVVRRSAFRSSSARLIRSAAWAAMSPTIPKNMSDTSNGA
jgi:hypothetical protein